MTDEKKRMADQTARALGCCVKYLTAEKVQVDDTIEKWLANFRDAKYIITDSFHGTVFSLIFQKQFYCFYNAKRGTARMDSLKKLTGLNGRFIQSTNTQLDIDIDYNEVENGINAKRKESVEFLESAL